MRGCFGDGLQNVRWVEMLWGCM